jgi:S-adenosylmethionine decarboxylase
LENGNKIYSTKGTHIAFDLYGINSGALNDAAYLSHIYKVAIEKSGAEVRKYQEVLFDPEGVTFTYILSESHASCHTYPNDDEIEGLGTLMGCIHTCGQHVNTKIAVDYIIDMLQPKEVVIKQLVRGDRKNKTMEFK